MSVVKRKAAEEGGASTAAKVLEKPKATKTYNTNPQLGKALILCRLASLNPYLKDVILPRYGELLAIGHNAITGGGNA